ncbi:hypothetical protein FKP32DRAFT_1058341 [Trametes sanguinea]|nr:hypothetical protein FKP32DRAFT_1058341 [Trametes sanguinea]
MGGGRARAGGRWRPRFRTYLPQPVPAGAGEGPGTLPRMSPKKRTWEGERGQEDNGPGSGECDRGREVGARIRTSPRKISTHASLGSWTGKLTTWISEEGPTRIGARASLNNTGGHGGARGFLGRRPIHAHPLHGITSILRVAAPAIGLGGAFDNRSTTAPILLMSSVLQPADRASQLPPSPPTPLTAKTFKRIRNT